MDVKDMIKDRLGITLEEEAREGIGEVIKKSSIMELQARERKLNKNKDKLFAEYEEKVQAIDNKLMNDLEKLEKELYWDGYRRGDVKVTMALNYLSNEADIEKSNLKAEYQEKIRKNEIELSEVKRAIGQFEIEHMAEIKQIQKERKLQEAREYLGIKEVIDLDREEKPLESPTNDEKDNLKNIVAQRFKNSRFN